MKNKNLFDLGREYNLEQMERIAAYALEKVKRKLSCDHSDIDAIMFGDDWIKSMSLQKMWSYEIDRAVIDLYDYKMKKLEEELSGEKSGGGQEDSDASDRDVDGMQYYDDNEDEEEDEVEEDKKPKDTHLYDVIENFLDYSLRERYEGESLVQSFREELAEEFERFGEGQNFDNDYSFCFKYEHDSGHYAIEVYTESDFIQITSCGYAIGDYGSDSYINWQCTLYSNGEIDSDVDNGEVSQALSTFPYAESILTIESPDEYSFGGEADPDDCKSE